MRGGVEGGDFLGGRFVGVGFFVVLDRLLNIYIVYYKYVEIEDGGVGFVDDERRGVWFEAGRFW